MRHWYGQKIGRAGVSRRQSAQLLRLAAKIHKARGETYQAHRLLESARLLENRGGPKRLPGKASDTW